MTSNDPAPDAVGPGEGAVLEDAEADWPGGVSPVLDQAFDAGTLYALRAAVQANATQLGMPDARTDDLVIAVHELAANAVRHGAGGGRVRLWQHAGELHCQVEDSGAPARGGAAFAPDGGAGSATGHENGDWAQQNSQPGANAADSWPFSQGHGLWLVRLVADEISVFSGPDGTCATVVFALPGAGAPSAQAY
jgi:two-component sensor histidine kinase